MSTDKKTDVWMPLWIGAYLADTMAFTTEQHGAYLLLILAYWRERAALPDDDETLRGITKLDRADWKRVRPVLAKKFRVADGVWWHKRVEQEMAAADERAKKAADKAKRAADARWQAQPEHAASNAPSIKQALQEKVLDECPPPSPSSPSSKKKAPPSVDVAVLVAAGFDGETAAEFIAHKARMKAPLTERAWNDHQREAEKAGWTPLAAAEKVMAKSWKGFEAKYVADEQKPAEATSKAAEETAQLLAVERTRQPAMPSPEVRQALLAATAAVKRAA